MTDVYRILAVASGTPVLQTIYTCGSQLQGTVLSSLVVCNVSNAATTFNVAVMPGNQGGNPVLKNYLYSGTPIDALDTFIATVGLTLSGSDYIQVQCVNNAQLAFQLYGDELS